MGDPAGQTQTVSVQDCAQRWARSIAAEKLALLYSQSPIGLSATTVTAGVFVFLQWGFYSRVELSLWLVYIVSVNAARFLLARRYQRTAPPEDEEPRWRRYFLIGTAAAGCGWGFASVFFFPVDSVMNQAFLLFLMGGLSAGAIAVLGVDLSAFFLFMGPTFVPLVIYLLIQPEPVSVGMGVLSLVFCAVMSSAGRLFHTSVKTSLELRFTNLELVQQLTDAKIQADTANLAKSAFLANMSHELRTPLHGILSFARFGLKKATSAKPEKLVSYFQQIEGSGELLLSLLNDLLDLAKLESGKMNFSFQEVDLKPFVRVIADEFQSRLAERQLRVTCHVPDESVYAVLDTTRFQQVLRNLLGNAVKFSPEQGTLVLQLIRQEECLRISVQDQGPGIPDGEFEAVFEKFIQSSRTKTNAGGTGLGLAICREIVAAHEGKIWAENASEGGTVFFVDLPLPKRVSHLITPVEETLQIAA